MNKLLIVLALIADAALIVNVVHHWEKPNPTIEIKLDCNDVTKRMILCIAHSPIKEEPNVKPRYF